MLQLGAHLKLSVPLPSRVARVDLASGAVASRVAALNNKARLVAVKLWPWLKPFSTRSMKLPAVMGALSSYNSIGDQAP